MLPTLRSRLDGPPLALPAAIDRLSERWWRARPRTRGMSLLAVGVLVVLAGIAHAAAAPYGPPTAVLVATSDLAVGHQLTPGDLRRTTWPRDLVPDGASTDLTGTVVGALPRGAVATDRHVTHDPVSAAVPTGLVAVGLPRDRLPPVPAGARLDLVATGLDGRSEVVATSAVVTATDDEVVWVAVTPDMAPAVAARAMADGLSVVLHPP